MLLPTCHLIRPNDYFITAFDTKPFDTVNTIDRFTIKFKCGSCKSEIESDPLMVRGRSLPNDRPLSGVDKLEFAERCRRLTEDRDMSLLLIMEQVCSTCADNHLILFGYTEWQPGRDMLEIGSIYLLA